MPTNDAAKAGKREGLIRLLAKEIDEANDLNAIEKSRCEWHLKNLAGRLLTPEQLATLDRNLAQERTQANGNSNTRTK